MSERISIALIGAGRMGQIHGMTLARKCANVHIKYVVDVDLKFSQAAISKLGIPDAKPSIDINEALQDPDVFAVVITTTAAGHRDAVLAAAAAGKHIFCEKPLATCLADTEKCVQEAKRAGVSLCVGFMRRFDPSFASAQRDIAVGKCGQLEQVAITSRELDFHNPPNYHLQSGGYFFDSVIHDFDYSTFLFGGQAPKWLFATGRPFVPKYKDVNDVSSVTVLMEYESGATCVIENNRRVTYGYDQRMEATGNKGMVQVGNRPAHMGVLANENGATTATCIDMFGRYHDAFEIELMKWTDHIVALKADPAHIPETFTPISQIAMVSWLCHVARISLNTHSPVRLNYDLASMTGEYEVLNPETSTQTPAPAPAQAPSTAAAPCPMPGAALDLTSLAGKVYVVTGGTQGLGECAARRIAACGARGVVICGRQAEKGADVAKSISEATTCKCIFVKADLQNEADCHAVIAACDAEFGTVDGVVNAAALTFRGNVETTTTDLWDLLMDVNARAPFLLIQDAVGILRRDKKVGSMVNIQSMSAHGGQPFLTPYSVSKGALSTLTKNLGNSLRKERIRVNGINMGWCYTPGEVNIQASDGKPADWHETAKATQPFGRILVADDVVNMVLYLLSDLAEMMTGSVIDLDQNVMGAYD